MMFNLPLPPCQVCVLLKIPCLEDCQVARFYGRQTFIVDIDLLKSYYNWRNMTRALQSLPYNMRRIALVSTYREAQARQSNIAFGQSLEIFTLRAEIRELQAQNARLLQQIANATSTKEHEEQEIPQTNAEQQIDKGKQVIGEGIHYEIGSSSQQPNKGKEIYDLTQSDDEQTYTIPATHTIPITTYVVPPTPLPFGIEESQQLEGYESDDLLSIVFGATKKRKID